MKATPAPPPPEPVPELEMLREQVRELTAVKTGFAFGHATYCGHAQHPTMTALAAQIAEKVNWRGEALRSRTVIDELRERAENAEATLARSRAALATFEGRGVNNLDIPTPAEIGEVDQCHARTLLDVANLVVIKEAARGQ